MEDLEEKIAKILDRHINESIMPSDAVVAELKALFQEQQRCKRHHMPFRCPDCLDLQEEEELGL